MTTALAHRSASGAIAIPATLPAPPVPAAVASFVSALAVHADQRAAFAAASETEREDLFVGSAPRPPMLRGADRDEAKRATAHMARQIAPVPHAVFRAWLGPVNAAVRNPQGAEDFEVRCAGLHALLDDLPVGCFTADARRALPAFFPSAEDIRRAVEPGARQLRGLAAALDAALIPPQPQPAEDDSRPPSPDEIAAMQAKAKQVAAELRGMAAEREMGDRAPARAVPLSDGALLERYDALAAQGNGAAKLRAAALRRQIGEAA